MATNRKYTGPRNPKTVDLASKPPGPPPKPGMTWFGPQIGWKKVVTDDLEDRKPLPAPPRRR